jgi:cytochrome P450
LLAREHNDRSFRREFENMFPADPVGAATHHDPYPYYNSLLAGPALAFDPHSALWVASRAEVIHEVLGNAHCTVRPSAGQVPSAIVGSSAGAVFSHLIRMNDGAAHAAPKFALQQALAGVDAATTADATHELGALLAGVYGLPDSEDLTPWTFDLPTWVVADLLGFERAHLPQLALWMAHFVACPE